jgi:hypothetical protein
MSKRKPVTEPQWFAARFVATLLYCLREREINDDRKMRLFAGACCRRVWQQLTDARTRTAVEVGERFADGSAPTAEVSAAATDAAAAVLEICEAKEYDRDWELRKGFASIYDRGTPAALRWAIVGTSLVRDEGERAAWNAEGVANRKELAANCHLFRDIFGNPFRPVSFSPSWRTDTAVSLARQMYESRDFSGMPILADALEDAGCDNDEVLSHCRAVKQVHVRGCWVVDALLQRPTPRRSKKRKPT